MHWERMRICACACMESEVHSVMGSSMLLQQHLPVVVIEQVDLSLFVRLLEVLVKELQVFVTQDTLKDRTQDRHSLKILELITKAAKFIINRLVSVFVEGEGIVGLGPTTAICVDPQLGRCLLS